RAGHLQIGDLDEVPAAHQFLDHVVTADGDAVARGVTDGGLQLHLLLHQTARPLPAQKRARPSRFSPSPTGLRGSSGQNSIDRGRFMRPSRSAQSAVSSSSVAAAPGFSSTMAFTASPQVSSGTPITTQSCTASCDQSTRSISAGEMLKPPLMIR